MGDETVTGQIHAVDLVEGRPDVLRVIEVGDGDNAHASLLKELYVRAWHIGDALLGLPDSIGLDLGTLIVIHGDMLDKVTLKGLRKHAVDGAPGIRHQNMTEALHAFLGTLSVR